MLGGFSPKTFERIVKYGDGYIGYIEALVGSFEYIHNSIKMFNDAIENSSRTRKEFDLTFFTNPRLLNSSISRER